MKNLRCNAGGHHLHFFFKKIPLFRGIAGFFPHQVISDPDRYQERHRVVNEDINPVIRGLEEQDDEQIVEHDGDDDPCYPDLRKILQWQALALPEPPEHDGDGDRGEDDKEDPAHDACIRRHEQDQ